MGRKGINESFSEADGRVITCNSDEETTRRVEHLNEQESYWDYVLGWTQIDDSRFLLTGEEEKA